MKTVKSTIIWTIVFFVALTLMTMKNEAASDGFDKYGFPLTYYDHFEGKCDNCYDKYGFKPLSLLTDILFATIIGFVTVKLKDKIFKRADDKKEN